VRRIRISNNSFVHSLVFTPDGRELLSAGDDGRMRRWSIPDGKELPSSFDAHPRVSMLTVSLSGDGKILATTAIDRTAKVWDATSNQLLATCPEKSPLLHACLVPDGQVLALATSQLRLWEASSGRLLADLTDPKDVRARFIEAVAFSSDGKRIACTGSPNTVRVWDVATRKQEATLIGHSDVVMALAFSSDGRTVASAGMDRAIKLWDLTTKTERLTLKGHLDPLNSVAFSPDGSLLVSGAGATRFNPGRRGEVKLWDVTTGKLLADLRGHADGISSVAFAPDGKTIASTGRDRTVRLWDVSAFRRR
jgi:WD40 repeat protein